MQKRIVQFIDFILFSNIFISIGAAAQVALTYQLLNVKPDLKLIVLVFLATLVLYNLSLILSKPEKLADSPFKRTHWFFSRQRFMASLTLIATFMVVMISLSISIQAQLLLAFLGIIALGYNIPILRVQHQKISLRNIPGLKLFVIALVWSLTAVVLPIIELEHQHSLISNTKSLVLLLAHRFIFITAITIPFDIRDLYQDKIYALKTIPVLLGESNSYVICQLLLLGCIGLIAFQFSHQEPAFWLLISSTLMVSWLIFKSQHKRNEYFYFLYLDGMLILPWLLLEAWDLVNY